MAQFTSRRSFRLRSAARSTRFRPECEALEARTLMDAGLTSLATGYDPNHILVQFQTGYDPRSLLPTGATLGEQLPLSQNLYVVNLPTGWSVTQMIGALQNNTHVLLAQPDYKLVADQTPNDPNFSSQWGLDNTSVPTASISATTAWNTFTGTGKMIVAVIDTGVDYTHPDLAANMWVNKGEIPGNGVDDDHDGYVDDVYGYDFVNNDGDPMDDNSHGTHCAGIIGAVGNNGIGVSGVIWDVQIMALKFMDASGSGSTSNAIKALNFAVSHGAEISSNSWGGAGFNSALNDAINNARAAGHIFVAAAGNSGANNDATPFYPSSYTQDNVVAVAATDSNDNLAGYSNYGATTVDLAAPGSSIYSTVPVSMGSYAYKSGTSMATPFVAGALALVWDAHPDWTYSQVINQVLSTVDQLPSLAGKVASGGRLNLANALGTSVAPPAAPALPSISINNVSITEGNSGTKTATFTVTLSAASTQSVTVNYATADGSATAGSDYAPTSGTVTFAAGETSKTISIVIDGDTTVEGNETFFVNLSNASNATIGTSQGVGTILNDDAAPTVTPGLSVNSISFLEGNKGTTWATFTVSLSQASSSSVSVKYATANGTATAGSDYTAASGTLTFSAGATSMTVKFKVTPDTTAEADETFYLNLSNPTNATITVSQGTATIRNDDGTIASVRSTSLTGFPKINSVIDSLFGSDSTDVGGGNTTGSQPASISSTGTATTSPGSHGTTLSGAPTAKRDLFDLVLNDAFGLL